MRGTRPLGRRPLLAAAGFSVLAACAPAPPSTASTVVVATCTPPLAQPYTETITSTATPARPYSGSTVRFELGVRRLQVDVGPMQSATYVFPVPAGVAKVQGVAFADANPNTWTVQGNELTVEFRGPDGSWLVNDFPRITISAVLSPSLRPGDTVEWKPYLRFVQRFVNFEQPLSCAVADPGLVLQRLVVR